MNARVLELIKSPELFQNEDLTLLNSEIKKHPYIQNIRALYLLGVHKYHPENYKQELTTTAAYTTDKKILYQFINKKEVSDNAAQPPEPINTEVEAPTAPVLKEAKSTFPIEPKAAEKYIEVEPVPIQQTKEVYVDGALNRILFEGEEDFMEKDYEVIDLESTLESGQIVTQEPKYTSTFPLIKEEEQKTEPAEKVTDPQVINSENIEEIVHDPVSEKSDEVAATEIAGSTDKVIEEAAAEKELIENPEEQSFLKIEEFSPEANEENQTKDLNESVAVQSETETVENTETIINDDEVSAEKEVVEDPAELSFHGLEDFLPEVKITKTTNAPEKYEVPAGKVSKHEEEMQKLIAEVEAKLKSSRKNKVTQEDTPVSNEVNFSETQEFEASNPQKNISSEVAPEEIKTETRAWKPMAFPSQSPDSLIQQKENSKALEVNTTNEAEELKTINTEKSEDERPVFNVSFFAKEVSSINKNTEEISAVSDNVPVVESLLEESNVPTFINTWQNWLKIDRSKEIAVAKEKAIENFIVNEPKISKLKDDSDFVVKEKGNNISHLMTETLANIYVEQRLYGKAIHAFGILSKKHPAKKEYFNDRINQIKELRQNR